MARMVKKGKWSPPPVGSKARSKIPRHVFLNQRERKYPYKELRNGRWTATEKGLSAARRRSILQNEPSITRKATTLLNKVRRRKGKEPVGQD